MSNKEKALIEIREEIAELEKRMKAGEVIRMQCKQQFLLLKKKLKEYRHIEDRVFRSAADGDL